VRKKGKPNFSFMETRLSCAFSKCRQLRNYAIYLFGAYFCILFMKGSSTMASVAIVLHQQNYTAGDALTGDVVVTLQHPLPVHHVTLCLDGHEKVHWVGACWRKNLTRGAEVAVPFRLTYDFPFPVSRGGDED